MWHWPRLWGRRSCDSQVRSPLDVHSLAATAIEVRMLTPEQGRSVVKHQQSHNSESGSPLGTNSYLCKQPHDRTQCTQDGNRLVCAIVLVCAFSNGDGRNVSSCHANDLSVSSCFTNQLRVRRNEKYASMQNSRRYFPSSSKGTNKEQCVGAELARTRTIEPSQQGLSFSDFFPTTRCWSLA